MIVLCCPQCQTKLPVPEEKLGKTLFVCPSCTYPLEASNQAVNSSEVTAAYAAAPFAGNPPPAYRPAPPPAARPSSPPPTPPSPAPAAIQASPKPAKAAKRAAPRAPAAEPASSGRKRPGGRGWLIGAVCVLGTVVAAGGLYLFMTGSSSKPKLGMLEVLALSQKLQDGSSEERMKAAMALGDAGRDARLALPALLEALKDEDEKVRNLVLDALDQVGEPAKDDFPILSLALRDEDPDVRAYATSLLALMGEDAWGELDEVRELKEDPDPYVRAEAEKTVTSIEKHMLEALTRKLKDTNPDTRREAAAGLGELGLAARSATASLIEALGDENDAVRRAARGGLVQLGPDIVPDLMEALRNRNANVRSSAIGGLADLGPDADEAIPAIVDMVEDPDPTVARDASAAVARFGEYAVAALAVKVEQTRAVVVQQTKFRDLLVGLGPRGAAPGSRDGSIVP